MTVIATWNQGYNTVGPKQIDRGWRMLLDELSVDVALVQETVIPDWVRDAYGVSFLRAWRNRPWGSAVVTRSRPHEILLADPDLRVLVVRAVVQGIGRAVLASLHARIINNRVIPQLRRSIGAVLPLIARQRFVLGGDLNTARRAHEFWPLNDHDGFWSWIAEQGWHDCHFEAYGREHVSLWAPRARELQTDHLFVDPRTASPGMDVEMIGQQRVGKLSDHAILLARIRHSSDPLRQRTG